MPADFTLCPGCATPMSRVAHDGVGYECPNCGGSLYGLSPFERMLGDGAGARLWVASQDGPPGADCPFCSKAMRQPGSGDAPAGLLLCHTCQQVWVPSTAAGWMSTHAAPGAAIPAPVSPSSQQCGNCGAPLEPDELGRCRYCHAQVTAPQPLIVEMTQGASSTGNRFLDGLSTFLTQPID